MDAVGHEGTDEGAQQFRRIATAARRRHHRLHARHQRVYGSGPRGRHREREGEREGEGEVGTGEKEIGRAVGGGWGKVGKGGTQRRRRRAMGSAILVDGEGRKR